MKQFLLLILVAPLFTFGQWTQIGSDIDGVAFNDRSGFAISISSDGSVLAVSSPSSSNNGTESGHVSLYKNIAGFWTKIGSDIIGSSGNELGYSVSLSNDGSIVAIGATAFISAFVIFSVLKAIGGIRVSEQDENRGLDISEHGMESYAGFQVFSNQ